MSPNAIEAEILRGRHLVPDRLWPGLHRYFVARTRPGGFLMSLLTGDLYAVVRADEQSFAALPDLVRFLHGFAPGGTFGSPDKVEAWLAGARS